MSNTNQLSPEYTRRILQSIEECDRPQEVKDLLAFYISHRAKLQAMLAQ